MSKMTRRMMTWATIMLLGTGMAQAQMIYVANEGTNDVANNFNTWEGAATNIHDAVALANTLVRNVMVSNGVYRTTSELILTNSITLTGVNGPSATTIARSSASNFRVFSLTNGAVVAGVTVSNGVVAAPGGAGVRLYAGTTLTNCVVVNCTVSGGSVGPNAVHATNATIVDCVFTNNKHANAQGIVLLTGNSSFVNNVIVDNQMQTHAALRLEGTGNVADRCRIVNNNVGPNSVAAVSVAAGNTLANSIVANNFANAASASGVSMTGGTVVNCTIVGNTLHATTALGGLRRTGGAVTNTIVYFNTVNGLPLNYNGDVGAVWHSCAPELTAGVQGNIVDNPMFMDRTAADYRLMPGSPCRDSGTNLASVVHDIDGEIRPQAGGTHGGDFHDMGAYEMDGTSGDFAVGFYGDLPLSGINTLEVVFHANAAGANTNVTWYGWDFNNDGTYELSGAGLGTVTNTFGAGRYSVRLAVSNDTPAGAMSTNVNYISVLAGTDLFVATNGLNIFPYTNWVNAATNIHDAMDAVLAGVTVHVGTGTFHSAREIIVDKASVTLRGSGPELTTIARDTTKGNFRVLRLLASGVRAENLTVADGLSTTAASQLWNTGAGLWMGAGTALSNSVVRNCSIGNSQSGVNAIYAIGASIVDCVVTNNKHVNANGIVLLDGNATISRTLLVDNQMQTESVIRMAGTGNVVDRCRIVNNTLGGYGGAGVSLAAGNTLMNSLIAGNTGTGAQDDRRNRGVYATGGTIINCTIADNIHSFNTSSGLERTGGSVTNTIIYGNIADGAPRNYVGDIAAVWHSCAPELTLGVQGNIVATPGFVGAGNYRLESGSPCINKGTNVWLETAVDLDGKSRIVDDIVDMGAYEFNPFSGPFSIGFYGDPPLSGLETLDVVFHASAAGEERTVVWYGWDFNSDGNHEKSGPDLATVTNTFGPGLYSVTLRASNSVGTASTATISNYVSVIKPDLYVATNGFHIYPFTNWVNAATNIHDAMNAVLDNCTVHVGEGTFRTREEIILTRVVTVRGRGPELTTVARDASAGTFRVFRLLAAGAQVENLTIADGLAGGAGGGVYMETGTLLTNCVVVNCGLNNKFWGNALYGNGATVVDCVFTNNSYSQGQGIVVLEGGSTITDSLLTDSLFQTYGALYLKGSGNTARRCRITGHQTGQYGAASGLLVDSGSLVSDSLIDNNTSSTNSAAVRLDGGTLVNCTIVDNVVTAAGQGGLYRVSGAVTNCIIYGNLDNGAPRDYNGAIAAAWYSCAPELTHGVQGNINTDPLFEGGGSYRLAPGSPAINAGTNLDWTSADKDLAGDSRIRMAVVDMGCYEAVPPSGSLILLR